MKHERVTVLRLFAVLGISMVSAEPLEALLGWASGRPLNPVSAAVLGVGLALVLSNYLIFTNPTKAERARARGDRNE